MMESNSKKIKCTGPDMCSCKLGWSGVDCTEPICDDIICGERQICTSPNSCTCIPGHKGVDCNIPKCVQSCINGFCSAPDTCTCIRGWFDPNCTTPVSFLYIKLSLTKYFIY